LSQLISYGSNTGSATIKITVGNSPYTYTWSPNVSTTDKATNISAGNYTITVTDNNGCSGSTVVITITQPSSPLRDSVASITYPLCYGATGSAIIGVKGGIGPYTYSWSPNISTTNTGTVG
jgi:hypothetical protein